MTGQLQKLTRAEIIRGGQMTYPTPIDALGGAELPLRRLASAHKAEIETLNARGVKVDIDISKLAGVEGIEGMDVAAIMRDHPDAVSLDIDVQETESVKFEIKVLAVKYGVALDDPLTDDDIRYQMDPEVVEEVARKVLSLSNLKAADIQRVQTFRE